MNVILGAPYNLYSTVLSTSAKTLTVSGIMGFDLEMASLQSVWSTTHSVAFSLGVNVVSCTYAYVAGLPVWTYTFTALPGTVANGDTLVIILAIPDTVADYSVLCYQASKL